MFRDVIILFFLIFLIIFLWFSKGLLFAGGEEGIPFYDLNKTVDFVSYSWQDVSGGFPTQLVLNRIPYFGFLKMFYSIDFSGVLVQAIHFFIIMFFGAVSFYFLLYETIGKELKAKNNIFQVLPLIGAIFYLLNPFSMTQIWGRGLYMQFFPFALFPFFLLMLILGLRYRNLIFGLLGLLASFVFAGTFGNPSYIFSFWIIILIYLICYIIKNQSKKNIFFSCLYFFFLAIGWFVISMWWIYPFLKISSNQFTQALNNTDANLGNLQGISKDYRLHSLLRLIHEGFYYRDQKYGESYSSFLFTLISWVIPIAFFCSLATFKKLKFFLFFVSLLLFSLFFCSGANPPLGWLFIFLFQTFPALQAFRNPFEKFGLVLTIAYAPFFAVGSVVISLWLGKLINKISPKFFLAGIIFLICGIFLWPIWTGHFAGGFKLNPWIKVPYYFKSLNDWLNTQTDDGRIIHFPVNGGDGLFYSGWEYPYSGIEPGEYIFSRPSIGKNGLPFKLYYSVLLERFDKFKPLAYGPDPDITYSEFRSDYLWEELAKLNVRYIILHKDIDPEVGLVGPFEPVEQYLETQRNIKKINTFGKLDVYKVEIPDDIHLIYSPDVKTNYRKINPTLYLVQVNEAGKEFNLYFLENFDAGWEAYIDGQKIGRHSKVFSYANKWNINEEDLSRSARNKTGSFTVSVKYKPQDFVNQGMRISISVVLIFSLICVLNFTLKIWKRRRKEVVYDR